MRNRFFWLRMAWVLALGWAAVGLQGAEAVPARQLRVGPAVVPLPAKKSTKLGVGAFMRAFEQLESELSKRDYKREYRAHLDLIKCDGEAIHRRTPGSSRESHPAPCTHAHAHTFHRRPPGMGMSSRGMEWPSAGDSERISWIWTDHGGVSPIR